MSGSDRIRRLASLWAYSPTQTTSWVLSLPSRELRCVDRRERRERSRRRPIILSRRTLMARSLAVARKRPLLLSAFLRDPLRSRTLWHLFLSSLCAMQKIARALKESDSSRVILANLELLSRTLTRHLLPTAWNITILTRTKREMTPTARCRLLLLSIARASLETHLRILAVSLFVLRTSLTFTS